ncbi:Nn.00g047280.m01.CDS01 [Neocucurbitaria sp. VM-36]
MIIPRTTTTVIRVFRPPRRGPPPQKAPPPRAPRNPNSPIPRVKPYRWREESYTARGSSPWDRAKGIERGVLNPRSEQFVFAFVMPKHDKSGRVQSALIFAASLAGAWVLTRWTMLAVNAFSGGDKNGEE